MKRLAVIDSHPIQYNAPIFQLLAKRSNLQLKVFYTWGEDVLKRKFDPGFGKEITWDIPLLEGYEYEFMKNVAPEPNASSFGGIDNPDIFRHIDAWKPDALLVFGWSFKTNLRILRHYKGKVPIIFRGDSTLLREKAGFTLKKMARRLFLRWVYRHVDTALFVGMHNKAYYRAHGVSEHKLVYAPHAIDNARFSAHDESLQREASLWKAQLGIPGDHLVVLFAGKLEPIKNVDYLLTVARQLKKEKISFIIVGNGPEEQRLKKEAEPFNHVHFLDFQNQAKMPLVYRLGDVLMLCSHSETWGLALNEAMACGLMITASETCGAGPELIEEGVNGISFAKEDTTKVVSFLTTMLQEPEGLKQGKQRSKELIQKFNFGTIAEAIEQVVNKG